MEYLHKEYRDVDRHLGRVMAGMQLRSLAKKTEHKEVKQAERPKQASSMPNGHGSVSLA